MKNVMVSRGSQVPLNIKPQPYMHSFSTHISLHWKKQQLSYVPHSRTPCDHITTEVSQVQCTREWVVPSSDEVGASRQAALHKKSCFSLYGADRSGGKWKSKFSQSGLSSFVTSLIRSRLEKQGCNLPKL